MKNQYRTASTKGDADLSEFRSTDVGLDASYEWPPVYDEIAREVNISQDDFHAHVELQGNKLMLNGTSEDLSF